MSELSGTCIGEDPVGIALKECLNLIIAIKKENSITKQKSSAAALILGGSNEYFGSSELVTSDPQNRFVLNDDENGSLILTDIVELKNILSHSTSIYAVDSVILLAPFLKALTEKSEVESIRRIVLESIRKFFTLQLINSSCINYTQAYRNTVFVLINLDNDFSNNQNTNDLMEIEIITLLQHIITTSCGSCLSDSLVYESLKKVLLIVCRRKLSDKLRVRAEYVLTKMTIHVFSRLKFMNLAAINDKYIDDEHVKKLFLFKKANDSSEYDLQEQIMNDSDDKFHYDTTQDVSLTENYGLPVIIQYLELLLSLISLENKSAHTMKTQILGLELINTMVELVGKLFLKHPRLLNMISDPVFKSIALILETNTDNILLMDRVLKVYVSIILSLGWFLPRQVELTLPRLFEKLQNSPSPQFQAIIIERLSLLWMREPSLFINLFVKYDCSFDFQDISSKFLNVMVKMSDPSRNLNVSIFALDALSTFINDVYSQISRIEEQQFDHAPPSKTLNEWSRKTEFIICMEKFNKKPKDGIQMFIEKNFINTNTIEDIAKFLFENDTRLNKKQLGLLLCNPDKSELLATYMKHFNFNTLRVDEALRVFLTKFRLPGESQQIERIIEAFSKRYVEVQQYTEPIYENTEEDISQIQPDSDSVFILSYSIIMLNTDFHNPQVKEHMSFTDYSNNLKGCYNNHHDYPIWFLTKIYNSIQDKEIVMPEEHHGSGEYFNDVWNNLISSHTVITEIPKIHLDDINRFTSLESAQFEMKLFEKMGPSIIEKLFELLNLTGDDSTISLLVNNIEHSYKICKFFKLQNLFNMIINKLAKMTTLLKRELTENDSDPAVTQEIGERTSVIDIVDEEDDDIITISSHSLGLGGSFKAQMCSVLYFNIFGHNKITNFVKENNWDDLVEILLIMFQDRMIVNNITDNKFFPDYNITEKYNLTPISPLPKADYTIEDINFKSNRGLFSSFASYLKGDDEPSEDDIRKAIKSNDCIKLIDFKEYIWLNKSIVTPKTIINLFEKHIPMERTVTNFKYYENKVTFIIELVFNLMFQYDWIGEIGNKLLTKLDALYRIEDLSKFYYRRIMVYKILLIPILNETKSLSNIIQDELIKSNEIFTIRFFNDTLDGQFIVREIMSYVNKDELLLWKFFNYLIDLHTEIEKVPSNKLMDELVIYISRPDNLSNDNIGWFIDLSEKLINKEVKLDDTMMKILKGEIKLDSKFESQVVISIIQLVLKQILQIEDEPECEGILKALQEALQKKKSILTQYDEDTIKNIIEHSMLSIIKTDDEAKHLFDSKVLKLSESVFLHYFHETDPMYSRFKQ
ncbi:ARF guanine-nucleotide exchange factor 1 [Monosporozyma servazzii]